MKTTAILLLLLAFATGLRSQTASEICLQEVQVAFQQIDKQQLQQQERPTTITYQHTYTMRTDPEKATVSATKSRTYATNFFHYDAPDVMEISDGKEAFNVRKYQYVIYRTGSTLAKSHFIPLLDPGVFEHCTVRECRFVPVPGNDTLSHKFARMTVDEAGQKKYQVAEMAFLTNPFDTTLISIDVQFTGRSLYTEGRYEIKEVGTGTSIPASAAAAILDESGALKAEYKGFSLKDYR